MAKQIKVKAACVVVKVEGAERYLYRGAVLPAGVEKADVTRLRNAGLLEEVEVAAAPVVDAPVADSREDDAAVKADPAVAPAPAKSARAAAQK